MEIEQLKKLQQEFDEQYFGPYERKPEDFLFFAVALAGEVGEFANLVKKFYREKRWDRLVEKDQNRDYLTDMKKEITDVFIYFLIIANNLNLEIEKEYLEKLEKNKKRFKESIHNS